MYRDILIIALSCLCGVALGMQQEVALPLQKPVYLIPVLFINNYVVNVSSAYKGLKKETFLIDDFSKSIIRERMNRRIKKEIPVFFLYDSLANRSYIKHSRPAQYPNFIYLYAVCTKSLQNEPFDMKIRVYPYVYSTDRGAFQHISCPERENKKWGEKADSWLVTVIEMVIQDMMNRGFKGTQGVELYYPNRISDWLVVEKKF